MKPLAFLAFLTLVSCYQSVPQEPCDYTDWLTTPNCY